MNLRKEEIEELLPKAVALGLDAMETMYPLYDESVTSNAKSMAESFGLLESGGSDFHGSNKPNILLGVGTGNLRVSTDVLDKLKAIGSNKIKKI